MNDFDVDKLLEELGDEGDAPNAPPAADSAPTEPADHDLSPMARRAMGPGTDAGPPTDDGPTDASHRPATDADNAGAASQSDPAEHALGAIDQASAAVERLDEHDSQAAEDDANAPPADAPASQQPDTAQSETENAQAEPSAPSQPTTAVAAAAEPVAPPAGSADRGASLDRSASRDRSIDRGGKGLGLRARQREASSDASQDRTHDVSVDLDPSLGTWLRKGLSPLESVAGLRAWCQPIDELLLQALEEEGVADTRQLNAARTILKQTPGSRIGQVIADQGVDERRWCKLLADELGLDLCHLVNPMGADATADGGADDGEEPPMLAEIDVERAERVGLAYCKERELAPLGVVNGRVILGLAHPTDAFGVEDVRLRLAARSLKLVVCPASELRTVLDSLGADEDTANVDEILSDIDEDDVQVERDDSSEVDLEREAAESPVIKYVNYIIQLAVKEGASDIHVEPGEKSLKVRFRIDGILFEALQPPAKMTAAITSRLKIMANLDISERRVPQDGRIRCNIQGRKLDLRVSTLPTANGGEKTVMRILDTKSIAVTLDDLGFDPDTLTIWKKQIDQPHGIVLVTGPTGSGKTTTLYASLGQMDKKTKNISTVEDPVEYHLDGVTQTQMHEKIGMTFAAALKSLLRQDPDVILLGEIRDIETATIAIQASLTGHLVLSTLHTNDAPSAVTRLGNIGVENFLIGAAMNAVLAQRLVRRICKHCGAPAELTEEMREFLEMQGMDQSQVFEGKGCDKCRGTGYSGRLGIYELLVVDDHLRDVIARGPNVTEFRRLCCERGMVTLRQDGFRKVVEGRTTPKEILRVTDASI